MLGLDGVSRSAKWRVLNMLERGGLVFIDRKDKKSPIVTININAEAALTKGEAPPKACINNGKDLPDGGGGSR